MAQPNEATLRYDRTLNGTSKIDAAHSPFVVCRTEGSTTSTLSFDGGVVLRTWMDYSPQYPGEPVLPARWDDVERLLGEQFDSNREAFERLT